MIEFKTTAGMTNAGYVIWIDTDEEKDRLYNALFRGTNTLSPPDHDLIKLLEDMKK